MLGDRAQVTVKGTYKTYCIKLIPCFCFLKELSVAVRCFKMIYPSKNVRNHQNRPRAFDRSNRRSMRSFARRGSGTSSQ